MQNDLKTADEQSASASTEDIKVLHYCNVCKNPLMAQDLTNTDKIKFSKKYNSYYHVWHFKNFKKDKKEAKVIGTAVEKDLYCKVKTDFEPPMVAYVNTPLYKDYVTTFMGSFTRSTIHVDTMKSLILQIVNSEIEIKERDTNEFVRPIKLWFNKEEKDQIMAFVKKNKTTLSFLWNVVMSHYLKGEMEKGPDYQYTAWLKALENS